MSDLRRCAAFVSLIGALLLLQSSAEARRVRVLGYSYDAVWSAAVRLIRVDGGYRINDKDKETGYILFTFPGSGAVKKCPASFELVQLGKKGSNRVRLQLHIEHQPSYIELHLLEKLEKKLRDERGRPSEPNPPPPDKGKNTDKDAGKNQRT